MNFLLFIVYFSIKYVRQLSGLEGVYRTTEQHIDLLVLHQGHHDRLLGNKAAVTISSELQSMLLSCASLDGLSKQVCMF